MNIDIFQCTSIVYRNLPDFWGDRVLKSPKIVTENWRGFDCRKFQGLA